MLLKKEQLQKKNLKSGINNKGENRWVEQQRWKKIQMC